MKQSNPLRLLSSLLSSLFSVLLVSSLLACGGGDKPAPMAPETAEPATPKESPEPSLDCSTPPDPVPNDPIATEPFSVTDERIEAGAKRPYGLNSMIISSSSEGGSHRVSIRGENECGLWVVSLYIGSEIGGDADKREETFSVVEKSDDGAYVVEARGAKLRLTSAGDGSFEATLLETIEKYEGE